MDAVAYFSWAVNYKSKMFVKSTTGIQPKGRLLALTMANTLAYNCAVLIASVKCFIMQTTGSVL